MIRNDDVGFVYPPYACRSRFQEGAWKRPPALLPPEERWS
jgi:hypothetical protein